MTSRWSRLVASLRPNRDDATARWREEQELAAEAQSTREAASSARPDLRIGVDFGTSTTQVAYQLGGSEPQLIRLERATSYMPSYFGLGPDGEPRFGAEAMNLPENVHSVKLLLETDEALPAAGGRRASEVAYLMIQEAVRRTIEHLRNQRILDGQVGLLQVTTNLGCTPKFSLDQRLKLRNVARAAGLDVWLADLVEEPVAAAFELIRSGVTDDGRLLVIDVGGGTMDVAVVTSSLGRKQVDLYATAGYALGGDRFTDVVVARIRAEVEILRPGHTRTRQDDTLIWQRAEAAKIALSERDRVVVALGGIAGLGDTTIEISRAWYEHETRGLVREIRERVQNVFRMARLVLDRGDEFDPAPGTIEFEEKQRGVIRRLTQVGLEDDGVAHLDGVIIVGGASRMPKLTEEFERIFGDKLRDPGLLGIEPIETVVLGLARNESLASINRMYPNWGVSLVFTTDTDQREIEVYQPFAPAFAVRGGRTSTYRLTVLSQKVGRGTVALAFRQVGGQDGVQMAADPAGYLTRRAHVQA